MIMIENPDQWLWSRIQIDDYERETQIDDYEELNSDRRWWTNPNVWKRNQMSRSRWWWETTLKSTMVRNNRESLKSWKGNVVATNLIFWWRHFCHLQKFRWRNAQIHLILEGMLKSTGEGIYGIEFHFIGNQTTQRYLVNGIDHSIPPHSARFRRTKQPLSGNKIHFIPTNQTDPEVFVTTVSSSAVERFSLTLCRKKLEVWIIVKDSSC